MSLITIGKNITYALNISTIESNSIESSIGYDFEFSFCRSFKFCTCYNKKIIFFGKILNIVRLWVYLHGAINVVYYILD